MIHGSALMKSALLRLDLSCSDSENHFKYTVNWAQTSGSIGLFPTKIKKVVKSVNRFFTKLSQRCIYSAWTWLKALKMKETNERLVRNRITRVSGAQLTLVSSNYVDTRPRSGNRRYSCDVTPGDFTCCGRAGENNRPATGSSSPGEDWVEKMIKTPRD